MKKLLSKHGQRYALFALLLLAFLLGSVSTYGFAGMDGQAVMVQAQGEENADDVLTGEAQKTPVVDTEEPETGEAGKIQKELEPVDPPTPEPEKPNDPEQPVVVDPLKNPDSEPGGLAEADKEKTIAPAEENENQPRSVVPNKSPKLPTNEEDTSFDLSEDVVPEAVRGGNFPFTVTKRSVNDSTATEELVREYDTFADAIENCKQGDLGNLYIITVNSDYKIPSDEYCYSKSSVHILLRSAEGQHYTLTRQGSRMHFIVSKDCDIKIENLTLDGNSDGEFTFLNENGQLTLGAGTIVQNFIKVPDTFGSALYLQDSSTLNIEEGVVIKNNRSETIGGMIKTELRTTLNINGGTFTNNLTSSHGGAIYSLGKLFINGGTFEHNGANKGAGGAIACFGETNISNAQFNYNSSATGGAIFAYSTLNLKNSSFSNNQSPFGGALYLSQGGDIEQSTFNNNEAGKSGGAIYSADKSTTIKNCKFNANSALNRGGALYLSGADKEGKAKPGFKVKISANTCFKENSVTSESSEGGAIFYTPYIYQNSITPEDGAYFGLTIDNTTLFQNNKAKGGLFNPPSTYAQFTNLGFSSDSDVTHGVLTRESVLNNYDVNFKNSACLITYIANGGEFVDGSEQQVEEHELDAKINLAAAPTRSGYRFTGWQAAQTMYQPGDDYTVKGNATFVAQWEAEETPTLRYPYPRCEIPVFTAPASVAPAPVPAAPNPKKIYNLPATGSASPALDIFMGLGLIFVGLLLKKRS